jgi:hypothetical protein
MESRFVILHLWGYTKEVLQKFLRVEVFWVMTLCSVVAGYRRHNPENLALNLCRCENLKFRIKEILFLFIFYIFQALKSMKNKLY